VEEIFMAKETPPSQEEKKAVSRREFLNFAWLASLGFMTVSVAGMTYLFAMPRFREGEFGGMYVVGTVADLPEAGSAPVNYPKVKFWLSNTDQGALALYKVCTHLGCLYNWVNQEVNLFAAVMVAVHPKEYIRDRRHASVGPLRHADRRSGQRRSPGADTKERRSLPIPDDPAAIVADTGDLHPGRNHG
jgi:cytochrome b6-f complex iron-sulfur subunit